MVEAFIRISPTATGYVTVGNSTSNDKDLTGINKGAGDSIIFNFGW